MKSFELYLLSRPDLQPAVFYWDFGYSPEDLERLRSRLPGEQLILTGPAAEDPGTRAQLSGEPAVLPVDILKGKSLRAETVIFAGVWDWSPLRQLKPFAGRYLVGELLTDTAFPLWEEFSGCSDRIHVDTVYPEGETQVLRWERSQDPALSLVFPMYRVEKYLPMCLQSVTAWKAPYVEFLFVDDGSPDGCGRIVEQSARRDSRIRLIEKENGGCASARQLGLTRARGTYVGFVDPDDFVDPEMFRKLLKKAMTGSFEICYCGYRDYFEETGGCWDVEDVLGSPWDRGVTDREKIRDLAVFTRVAIWRGIYRRDMLERENIGFQEQFRRFDDLPFKIETFFAARSLVTVPEHLYYYRLQRPGQDVAADDQRLYVHFDIFRYLNEKILPGNDPQLVDNLQLCKVQTHRYAVEKLKSPWLREYVTRARADLQTTGGFFRTAFLVKKELGRRALLYYLGIRGRCILLLRLLRRKK